MVYQGSSEFIWVQMEIGRESPRRPTQEEVLILGKIAGNPTPNPLAQNREAENAVVFLLDLQPPARLGSISILSSP